MGLLPSRICHRPITGHPSSSGWCACKALLVGPSGAGKSTLLRLLADGEPKAAEVFEVAAARPVPILDETWKSRDAPDLSAPAAEALSAHWRGASTGTSSRTYRWKAFCVSALDAQQQLAEDVGPSLLLLDEVFDALQPSSLRRVFAADLLAAARSAGFAALVATHCLKGDVSWLAESVDQVVILEQGRIRRTLRPRTNSADAAALQEYATLRSRLGTVNP
eukprot:TRINITY_DN11486_c0_g2_i5.p1 TRINITY_DN11486_c0_g2~~TRINITY_DN11486_c0_g2_i5.p1  ORF type:complete len:221 (-),score=47.50 TRINITY_DN11486_c0_g2_i5:7-669(-)